MTKKKIMIVEDDLYILEAMRMFLEDAGYSVEALTSGEDIKVDGILPDIFLLDVLLPGISGDRIAEGLKKDSRTKNLPVLLISGNDNLREVAKRSKADDYLEKPFEFEDLIRLVEKYLQ